MSPRTLIAALIALACWAQPALAYDAQREARNFAHIDERRSVEQSDPAWYATALQNGATDTVDILTRDATSGGDRFSGSLCGSGMLTCAGDPRTRDWSGGVSTPVIYKNRNGAHIEGHIWVGNAYKAAGAAALPGVVIETGSVQAPERWYYWAAQVLATHGYEVMTFDVQGQGRSDFGGTHDQHFFDGVPAQDETHFEEDLVDAIKFFRSADNPHRGLLDPTRLGIVGHSLGASSVSGVQQDGALGVDAIVAWDNLSSGVTPKVPALAMSADYYLDPTPNTSDPDPDSKSTGFAKWKAAGVDAMQVNLRGATHYEWSYAPMMLPASLRGIDAAAWYTTAWLDKYVKGDASADARLLTNRWTDDPVERALDADSGAGEGGTLYSFYFRSPLAFTLANGTKVACADARSGCGVLLANDGVPRDKPYSYLTDRG